MITWGYVGKASSEVPRVGYAEIARDPVTNDVALPIRIIRGPDAIIQRIRQRFTFGLGEWFLDQRLGVPYHEDILVKNPDVGLITSIFRRILVATPGVGTVLTMKASIDFRRRELSSSFEARLTDPNVIVRAVDAPFKIK